jgi:hypothetical protein
MGRATPSEGHFQSQQDESQRPEAPQAADEIAREVAQVVEKPQQTQQNEDQPPGDGSAADSLGGSSFLHGSHSPSKNLRA